jgi:hypothetical protein
MPKVNHYIIRDKETNLYYNIGDWVKFNYAYNYSVREITFVTIGVNHEWIKIQEDGKAVKMS